MKEIGAEAHAVQKTVLLVIEQLAAKNLIDLPALKYDLHSEVQHQKDRYPELAESLTKLIGRIG